ncbi:helix-turn-helix domain-containing protein [uncultured Clostridium sp.]|uniref:helix-turn-helix domain-containing protein n=1 Tax=uncultured Clostridium sp. TaxID=59620 RepID=UPI0026124393|nr:helix-turn-helix transcriptional regulator [uncultured Clostridium sp.]
MNKVFAERLKKCRLNVNFTQTALAKELKCATGVIGDIERGARTPSKNMAVKLADFFDTNVTYWLNAEEEIKSFNINLNAEVDIIYQRFLSANKISSPQDLHRNEGFKKSILNIVENYLTLEEINKEQD